MAALFLVRPAAADWPMARHDRGRRAIADVPSRLETPAITWRQYLGGSLAAEQQLAVDVDGDTSVDIVMISGGRLIVKRADDSIVWETSPYDLWSISGARDLDHDGVLDVVAIGTPGRVMVFSGRDGSVEWYTQDPPFGAAIGAVRFARLDGDEYDDMYVADAACGNIGRRGDIAFGYSFAHGFGSGVDTGEQRLWQLEQGRDYNCGINDVVADLNNDGISEVVAFGSEYVYLFDGRTGAKIRCSGSADPNGGFPIGFPLPYGQATTQLTDVDGDGSLDIVGYTDSSSGPTLSSHAVLVISYDVTRPPSSRLFIRWVRSVASVTDDSHPFVDHSAVDLDGDGRAEVTTTMTEGGVSRTFVLNGVDGTERWRLEQSRLLAVLSFGDGQRPTVLVHDLAGDRIQGYRFDSFGAGTSTTPWLTLPNGDVLRSFDPAAVAHASASTDAVTIPIAGTNRRGVLLNRRSAVELWDAGDGAGPNAPTAPVASYALDTGIDVLSVAPQRDVYQPGPGILLTRSDGYLVVLDAALHSVTAAAGAEITLPGIRVGGYYSGTSGLYDVPLAARFENGHDEVIALDSRVSLQRLDVARATLTTAPIARWQWQNVWGAVAIDSDGDGIRDQIEAHDETQLFVRGADGTSPVYSWPIVETATQSTGFAPALVANHAVNEFAFLVYDGSDGNAHMAVIGPSGVRFRTAPSRAESYVSGNPFADDIDGDGIDEVISNVGAALRVYDGRDGTERGSSPSASLIPMSVRGLSDAVTHVQPGSTHAMSGLSITATPTWNVSRVWAFPSDFSNGDIAGAALACPGGAVLVTGEYAVPHFHVIDLATGSIRTTMILAAGRTFADDATLAASGVLAGQIGNAVATDALYPGQSAMLVPSSDGYLYAIDVCAATPRLLWSMNFRAPVGEPIIADTDGDGEGEIVVGAADGFLYGVDTQQYPPPAWVHDVQPGSADTADVNTTRGTSIEAVWAEVPGATAYEWAVFTIAGTPVSRDANDGGMGASAFTQVAADVHRANFNTGLVDRQRYFFSVRAIGPGGTSPEVASDGTTYQRGVDSRPDAGMDGGVDAADGAAADAGFGAEADGGTAPAADACACRAPRGDRGAGLVSILAGLVIVASARRRRRCADVRGRLVATGYGLRATGYGLLLRRRQRVRRHDGWRSNSRSPR
jgi:hypothetical protein